MTTDYDPQAATRLLTAHLADGPIRPLDERPAVDLTNEQVAYDALLTLTGELPGLYVRSGGICWVRTEAGKPKVHQLMPDNLRAFLNRHVRTFVVKVRGRGNSAEQYDMPAMVPKSTCATLLAEPEWPAPELRGIVTSPVLRPDARLLQTEGYDADTGLYLHPTLPLRSVPDNPTPEQIAAARELLVGKLLVNFPFVHPSDRAQYIAGLLAPIMRPFVPGPTPMLLITATAPGTGKGALTEVFTRLYGTERKPWPGSDDAELRKVITTMLRQSGDPVCYFDNVPSGHSLKAAVLADLMTAETWSDRILGSTADVTMPNDRLWIANGNNLRTGGDMARRTLWVRLDAECPNPDQRDDAEFEIGDLGTWLYNQANAGAVLAALLTLVTGWVAAGAPTRAVRMGGYSRWATTLAGLLDWAEIPGFLTARAETSVDLDEETEEWHALLGTWHRIYPSGDRPAKEVLFHSDICEHVPRNARGELPQARQFGKWLQARQGRFYGPYRLVRTLDTHTKTARWRVECQT